MPSEASEGIFFVIISSDLVSKPTRVVFDASGHVPILHTGVGASSSNRLCTHKYHRLEPTHLQPKHGLAKAVVVVLLLVVQPAWHLL